MTTRRGYFRPDWNPTGLWSTPSITAPSRLFQDTTSIGATGHAATWAPESVSLRGCIDATGATYTSGNVVASLAMKAVVRPSCVTLKPEPIHFSAGACRLTACVD